MEYFDRIVALADRLRHEPDLRVAVLIGAGASVDAGIPDFRGKDGIYHRFGSDLSHPEQLFEREFYLENQEPFCKFWRLMRHLDPDPTQAHRFVAALAERGQLLHCYTQNIDGLERRVGVPPKLITEAHGSVLNGVVCARCGLSGESDCFDVVTEGGSVPRCEDCDGPMKPSITFFGDPLPDRFSETSGKVRSADVVLVIGSSLKVYPFNSLPELAPPDADLYAIDLEHVALAGGTLLRGEASDVCTLLSLLGGFPLDTGEKEE